jgi:hypothetical protein
MAHGLQRNRDAAAWHLTEPCQKPAGRPPIPTPPPRQYPDIADRAGPDVPDRVHAIRPNRWPQRPRDSRTRPAGPAGPPAEPGTSAIAGPLVEPSTRPLQDPTSRTQPGCPPNSAMGACALHDFNERPKADQEFM